jgi:hypothetical protein
MRSWRVAGRRRGVPPSPLWPPIFASAADYWGGGQCCPFRMLGGRPGRSVDIIRCTVSPSVPLDLAIIISVVIS